ncbi:MAG: transposase [Pyrinomonadaceae bacterium]
MTFWNDTDIPLAYLITFRTYGSWLPGDERGSIDRFNNKYLAPRVAPNPILERQHRKKLKSNPVILNAAQRSVVDAAIREVCEHRDWILRALNVRTHHAHAVVSIGPLKPFRALNAFKAYSTRRLREHDCWTYAHSPWVAGGSERWLWTEDDVFRACDYVVNGQGADLGAFDKWAKS